MKDKPVDVAIIGAGAAGLITAIGAAREAAQQETHLDILLLDSKQKIGAKILMSGGTRCNVTNERVTPFDFEGGPKHFIKHVLEAFTPDETMQFFKEIGVELILEPTGKYFPKTHLAQTVLEALLKEVSRLEIKLTAGVKICEVRKTNDYFELTSEDKKFKGLAKKIVMTTGGLSHPTTGSDGTGYSIAQKFGHHRVSTFPALTPLMTQDPDWKSLSGITLEVELSFYKNRKKQCSYRDSFLFTHFGFSGPAALDISRHFAASAQEELPEIKVSFLPNQSEESFKKIFESIQKNNSEKLIKNFFSQEFNLPARFVEVFLKKNGIDSLLSVGKMSGEKRCLLSQSLFHYPLEVSGVYGYQKAEVTAGGIDLKEIKVQTMESKIVNGLYFAGEILDIDGRIGGFNFQWAWSSGMVAGRSAARSFAS